MCAPREIVQITDTKLPVKARIVRDCDESLGALSHIHDEVELLFLTDGAMEFTVENQTITLLPGQVIFIRGLAIHSSRVLHKNTSTLCILQFPIELAQTGHIGSIPHFPNFIHEDTADYFLFTEADAETAEIIEILKDTVREFNGKQKAYDLVLRSYLYKLVSILYRKNILVMRENITFDKDYPLERLITIMKYIENNYMNKINAKDAANALNINSSYFCRLFKKMTGETFIQYLQYFRILAVKKMLLDKSKSISEIMEGCGFTSSSYFNKLFREKTGHTPTEYRAKLITEKITERR